MTNEEFKDEVLEENPQEQSFENQIIETPTPSEENFDGAEPFLENEEEEYSKEDVEELLRKIHEHQKEFRYYKPLPNGVT